MSRFDYRPRAEHLEPSRAQVVYQHEQNRLIGGSAKESWAARAVAQAAVRAAHGCLEEDSIEEYERWDGMA